MCASGNSLRIALIASMPHIFGICRSISVTSGRWFRNCSTASCPSHASATSSMSAWVPSRRAMPSRTTAWSSTARIRITVSPRHPREPRKTRACRRPGVGDRTRNAQIDLSPCSGPTQNNQFRTDPPRALPHSRQTVVPRAPLFRDFWSDPFAVVADSQTEELLLKCEFCFDPGCVSVSERISQCFARDAVNFVPNDRIQIPYRSFYSQTETRTILARQFLPHLPYGVRKIAGRDRRPQVLHCAAALDDGA